MKYKLNTEQIKLQMLQKGYSINRLSKESSTYQNQPYQDY